MLKLGVIGVIGLGEKEDTGKFERDDVSKLAVVFVSEAMLEVVEGVVKGLVDVNEVISTAGLEIMVDVEGCTAVEVAIVVEVMVGAVVEMIGAVSVCAL